MGPDGLSKVSFPTQNEGCRMEGLSLDVEECSVSMLAAENTQVLHIDILTSIACDEQRDPNSV